MIDLKILRWEAYVYIHIYIYMHEMRERERDIFGGIQREGRFLCGAGIRSDLGEGGN